MNRNNFAFYTEFGINKTFDLINVSDSNIFLLLSIATNQTSQITRYSAVYIHIYLN